MLVDFAHDLLIELYWIVVGSIGEQGVVPYLGRPILCPVPESNKREVNHKTL